MTSTTTPAQRGEALCAQASFLAEGGKLAEALPLFGEALQLAPTSPTVLIAAGHALAAAGEQTRAGELAQRAAQLAPMTMGPWLLLGLLAHDAGDGQRALESFALARARCATDDERDAVALAESRTLAAAGEVEAALQAVAHLGDDVLEVSLLKATQAQVAGDDDRARTIMLGAAEKHPDHPEPYKRLAMLLATSDRSLARELARHAAALAPQDAEARDLVDALGL